ncbi:TD and POZ domain-containing protein 1-like [Leptopilina heterotoma]|uniref:TD and POZ domain-containing protein 1-like n=1 Tax=Leptopilina heterotoma TaxID=63436 RepID=UPI001CA8C980|nr:TD and POZ domain-containing protein 1-like [Leptopilina heterotoma]
MSGESSESFYETGIHLITSIIKSERVCTWEIKEFSSHIDIFQNTPAESKIFPSNFNYETKFQFQLIYSSKHTRQPGKSSYFVQLEIKPSKELQKCIMETTLQNQLNTDSRILKSNSVWTKDKIPKILMLEIESSIIEKLDSNDSLMIRCNVSEFYLSSDENPGFHRCPLSIDLDRLRREKLLTDFTFTVGESSFKVHKAILSVRSPVFLAMFKQNLTEKTRNVVNIPDIHPIAFNEMLRFIYTGNVKDLKNFSFEILEAADKYQIEELKEMCEKIFSDITVREAPSILLLADRHNAKNLRAKTLKFLRQNIKDAISTSEFSELYSRQDLMQEILEAVVDK